MLKVATPVGASNKNRLFLLGDFPINAFWKHLIREDFLVLVVPYMMILSGGFGEGFLK